MGKYKWRVSAGYEYVDAKSGYVEVKVVDHPVFGTRYVTKHRLVWWENTGEHWKGNDPLVHHKDDNKQNNDFDNLEKMNLAEHARMHMKGLNQYVRRWRKNNAPK